MMPLGQIRPVDQDNPDLGEVEQAGAEVVDGDRGVVEDAHQVEIIDAEIAVRRDRRAHVADRGDIGRAVDGEIPIVIGEIKPGAVAARDPPAGAHRCDLSGDVRLQGVGNDFRHQTRTSMRGI